MCDITLSYMQHITARAGSRATVGGGGNFLEVSSEGLWDDDRDVNSSCASSMNRTPRYTCHGRERLFLRNRADL